MSAHDHPAVRVLNRAFAADPTAIHALCVNRVPCNQDLVDDPTIIVESGRVNGVGPTVGLLGVVNGILWEMGQPLVAMVWSDAPDHEGLHTWLGFVAADPPSGAGLRPEEGRGGGDL